MPAILGAVPLLFPDNEVRGYVKLPLAPWLSCTRWIPRPGTARSRYA